MTMRGSLSITTPSQHLPQVATATASPAFFSPLKNEEKFQSQNHLEARMMSEDEINSMDSYSMQMEIEDLGFDAVSLGEDEGVLKNFLYNLLHGPAKYRPHLVAEEMSRLCGKYQGILEELKSVAKEVVLLTENRELTGFGINDVQSGNLAAVTSMGEELRIIVVGENSCGKSLVLDLICCENLLPSKDAPCTPTICELRFGIEKRVVIHTPTGKEHITLEHGVPTDKLNEIFLGLDREHAGHEIKVMEVYYPSPFLEGGVVLVDTPGLGENPAMDKVVHDYIDKCHGVLAVIDSAHGFRNKVKDILNRVSENGSHRRPVKVILNKWDMILAGKILQGEKYPTNIYEAHLKTLGELLKNATEKDLITMKSLTALKHLSRTGGLDKGHQELHNMVLGFISRCYEIETQVNSEQLISGLNQIIGKIDTKLSNSEQSREEKKKRLEELQHRVKALNKASNMDAIAKEGEKELLEACNKYATENLQGITSMVIKICGMWKKSAPENNINYGNVTNRIQYMVQSAIVEAMVANESEKPRFSLLRQKLLEKMQSHLGNLDPQYSVSQHGRLRLGASTGGIGGQLAGGSFRLLASIATSSFFVPSPEAQRQQAMKAIGQEDFDKFYVVDSLAWVAKYATAYLKQCYKAEYIKERVEVHFSYSPRHQVRNYVDFIKQAAKNEATFLNDLKDEERDSQCLHGLLDPLKAESEQLRERVERLSRRLESSDGLPFGATNSDPSMEEILFDAIKADEVETVEKILTSTVNLTLKPFGCFTPLHFACALGLTDVVDALLKARDFDPNLLDEGGNTAFLIACAEGHTAVVKRMLRDRHVKINLPDANSATPLWWAAFWGREEVIRLLIASGRVLDYATAKSRSLYSGTTPLEIATRKRNVPIMRLLSAFIVDSTETRAQTRGELNLKTRDLEVTLKVALSDVAQMSSKDLWLIDSGLKEVPPALAGCGSDFQLVDMSFNQIVDIPQFIFNYKDLTNLNWTHNQLTEVPEELKKLRKLLDLDLSYNRISKIHCSFLDLTQLVTLDVSHNQLETLPDLLRSCKCLVRLDASNNRFTSIPLFVVELTGLKEMSFRNNLIPVLLETLHQMTELKTLDLSGNRFSILPEIFDQVRVEELNLSNNQLSVEAAKVVGSLIETSSTLRKLRLLNNKFFNEGTSTILSRMANKLNNSSKGQFTLQEVEIDETKVDPIPLISEEEAKRGSKAVAALIINLSHTPRSEPIRQSKILLIGQPLAGKTSLYEALYPLQDAAESQGKMKWKPYNCKLQGKTFAKYDNRSNEEPHKNRRIFLNSTDYTMTEQDQTIVLAPRNNSVGTKKTILRFDAPEIKEKWVRRISRCLADSSTLGIEIAEPENQKTHPDLKVAVWDFGGPLEFHKFHHHFYTVRSAIVVVWDMRQKVQSIAGYLQSLSAIFPPTATDTKQEFSLFVVGNFLDLVDPQGEEGRKKEVEELINSLSLKHPFQYFEVSATANLPKCDRLKAAIYQAIGKHSYLGDRIPEKYMKVQESLIKRREKAQAFPIISIDSLRDDFPDSAQLKAALLYLSSVGECLFLEDPSDVADTVVLSPTYFFQSIFARLFSPDLKNGKLPYSSLKHLWSQITKDRQRDLLGLLARTDSCFSPKSEDHHDYLDRHSCFPALLPDLTLAESDKHWAENRTTGAFHVDRHIQFLPLPEAFVCKIVAHMGNKWPELNYWKTGIIISKGNWTAMIRRNPLHNSIQVSVTGFRWTEIVDNLESLVGNIKAQASKYPGISFRERVSSPFSRAHLVDLETVMSEYTRKEQDRTLKCPHTNTLLPIDKMLSETGKLLVTDRTATYWWDFQANSSPNWTKMSGLEATSCDFIERGKVTNQNLAGMLSTVFGNNSGISTATAIHNPALSHDFHITLGVIEERMKKLGNLFFANDSPSHTEERKQVQAALQAKTRQFQWNTTGKPLVLPAYFATSKSDAWEICRSGFKATHWTNGNFGDGIYLTTDLAHCPKSEALIVVLINLGNTHLAVESPDGSESLQGNTHKASCHSYYALVNPGDLGDSMPYDKSESPGESPPSDEIVVFEESKLLPLFVLLGHSD